MSKYIIDKRYKTKVDRSDRVLEISEAFGIGLDDKEFVVFDKLEVSIEQGDVVYITGQSGSGKSTILRELTAQMTEEGLHVAVIDKVQVEEKPLVDSIGKDTRDALNILSIVGITDAYLFVRKPSELSDGQLYRFKLAKLIESGAKVWVADEFLAVLDRDTAKVIAFNLQRIARQVGATVLVATTHSDMVQDLAPNVTINKRYRERVEIIKAPEGYKDLFSAVTPQPLPAQYEHLNLWN
ncbi:ATP-binding cassette domain-containing protein [Acinetobacter brisouii]|uniref:ATP-binding cassette domain-containing protein n=1 Tax=Acinetobacter brisouii TaxID=396323 RepID=UPI00124E6D6E|nr:ATP-binding cassette domain-containing protein [Acinetobacter brisouii]